MARPERPLEPDGTPLIDFALRLRDLRASRGLTYTQLAARSNYSVSTLQEACAGRRLPTLDVAIAFATACGADVEEWRAHWLHAHRAVAEAADTGRVAPTVAEATDLGQPSGPPGPPAVRDAAQEGDTVPPGTAVSAESRWRLRTRLLALASCGLAALATTAALLYSGHKSPSVDFASATVQNKVAFGASGFSEDTTPVYLSSRTVSRCAARGCEVAGTEMWSGAKVVVSCWRTGEKLTNEDVTSAGIERNPYAFSSDRWYSVLWKDGRHGYLSQVYVDADSRGTLGLRRCT
ncbi:Helix-turn-helix domain-containing protein [Actinacidiphila alni]|uniref:Helix-turn-helix domain-containing protein n=1 Tax=Actinacidiphila alni TaxID=380248 RepID=A0A1I2HZ21_9ACTN|nr:helix-turn-helix transcriptional regulator [Actinacidiphila alni]SFF35264.1 Helix-turn-helix domain-containing protein [Actinacidiphila alni]